MSPTSPVPSSAGSRSGGVAPPASAKSQQSVGKASVGFDDLWSMSLGSSGIKPSGSAVGGKSMKDLEKEKAQAGIWGAGSGGGSGGTSSLFDIGSNTPSSNAGAGAGDDLLL